MTNAEKYKEVFGFEVDKSSCPTKLCKNCPLSDYKDEPCRAGYSYHWWDSEYEDNYRAKWGILA